jgi:hypothetical protein
MQLRLKDNGARPMPRQDESDINHLDGFITSARSGQVRQAAAHLARIIPEMIESINSLREDVNALMGVESAPAPAAAAAKRPAAKKAQSRKATKASPAKATEEEVEKVLVNDELQD